MDKGAGPLLTAADARIINSDLVPSNDGLPHVAQVPTAPVRISFEPLDSLVPGDRIRPLAMFPSFGVVP